MQPYIINLVHVISIKSREYQRTLLEYIYSPCAKLEDSYTLNENAGLYLALMVNMSSEKRYNKKGVVRRAWPISM